MMHVATVFEKEQNHNCTGVWRRTGIGALATQQLWWVFEDGREVSDKEMRSWLASHGHHLWSQFVTTLQAQAWSEAHPAPYVSPDQMSRGMLSKLEELESALGHAYEALTNGSPLFYMSPEERRRQMKGFDIILGNFGIKFL